MPASDKLPSDKPAGDKVFAGSVPAVYQSHMVPLIFTHYAADIADRVAATTPGSVLEIAAGSGVVARALAPKLATTARYHITDLNQPMLDVAMQAQGADARLHWQTADAQALPFEDGTFDCVLCQFGAMFFPDRIKAYAEAKRVLKPGGLFVFNVWDRIEENAFADNVSDALAAIYTDNPPQFMARTPHGYHDTAAIRRDVSAAGFTSVTIETLSATSRAPSAHHVATAYCQGTPMRSEIESRGGAGLQAVTDRVADALAQRHGQGEVSGGFHGTDLLGHSDRNPLVQRHPVFFSQTLGRCLDRGWKFERVGCSGHDRISLSSSPGLSTRNPNLGAAPAKSFIL